MTEKQLRTRAEAVRDPNADATLVDQAPSDAADAQEFTPYPSQPTFDPGKFSEIVVSADERKKMLQVKLPRLDQQFFQDTVPPVLPVPLPPVAPDAPVEATVQRAVGWRRGITLGVFVASFFALALGVLGLLGAGDDRVPSRSAGAAAGAPAAAPGREPAPRAAVRALPEAALRPSPDRTNLPVSSSAASSDRAASPVHGPNEKVRPIPKRATPVTVPPASSPSSVVPGPKSLAPSATDGPDFEQPFNPQ
jgi:hypothetical protein